MNRQDLANEVADYIRTNVGENDTDDVDLGAAAAEVESFISDLESGEDGENEAADDANGTEG